MAPLIIQGMWGLGDNIYQRAFIRELRNSAIYLDTPWPELYEDFGHVKFLVSNRGLRTQEKNIARQSQDRWSDPPRNAETWKVSYGSRDFKHGSITDALYQQFRMQRSVKVWFDLPQFAPLKLEVARPIALVRPATVRAEWRNEARNPLPKYVAEIAACYMNTHHVVIVADLYQGHEWMVGEVPHHQALVNGELNVRQLLGLVQQSDVLIGGVGWLVPAAIAARKKAFILLGGNGEHNAPAKILDPLTMDLSLIGFATPDRFCLCDDMRHQCNKTISNLDQQFDGWVRSLSPSTICSMTS